MQVTKESTSPTAVKLTVTADATQLADIKQHVLQHLAKNVKIQGFRSGKAPLNIVERNLEPTLLQSEFLEQAVNTLYPQAVDEQKVRPVSQPQISITKYVPFSTLEFTAEVEAVGDIKLGTYTKLGVTKKTAKVTAEQVDEIIADLLKRAAKREEVKRAAKNGDEAVIDFAGVDTKTKEPLANTDGTDYPLQLGSGNFIPGFEDEIVGLKAGDEKTFTITFPADYGAKDMQSKKVDFTVTVKKVNGVVEPALDDAFAATVGPFKTVDELKTDIKRELAAQADRDNENGYESDLLQEIAKNTKVTIPTSLVDEELDRLERQERQNLMYRGQTWQEHLDEEGVTNEEHREKNREGAELRVKTGLILGEIAEAEGVTVTPEELEIRMQLLKGQYATDPMMQAELEKPENIRDIQSRLMTEKTLDKLKSLQ